jgi:hypothetical protein
VTYWKTVTPETATTMPQSESPWTVLCAIEEGKCRPFSFGTSDFQQFALYTHQLDPVKWLGSFIVHNLDKTIEARYTRQWRVRDTRFRISQSSIPIFKTNLLPIVVFNL